MLARIAERFGVGFAPAVTFYTPRAFYIKAAFGAAKVDGFDPKVLRLVLRLRKLRPDEREEQTALVETYLAALGM